MMPLGAWSILAGWGFLGAYVTGAFIPNLRFGERILVSGVLGTTIAVGTTYVAGLAFGISPVAVLVGIFLPILLAAAIQHLLHLRGRARDAWKYAWSSWSAQTAEALLLQCLLWAVLIGGSIALFSSLFLVRADGAVVARFPTVWADWALHLGMAQSFAIGHNMPAKNIVFANTAMYYPPLPDFAPALLRIGGLPIVTALDLLSGCGLAGLVLGIYFLARELVGKPAAAAAVAVLMMLGGGLGFWGVAVTAWQMACSHAHLASGSCTLGGVAHASLGRAFAMVVSALGYIPHVLANQSVSYDGLETAVTTPHGIVWNTPLYTWWLPQRTYVVGMCVAVTGLLALLKNASWSRSGAVLGIMLGWLPIIHVESYLVIVGYALIWTLFRRDSAWRWAWPGILAIGGAFAFQLATVQHGSALAGNQYPWIDVGWYPSVPSKVLVNAPSLIHAVGEYAHALFTARYWGHWLVNTGIAVPCTIAAGVLLAWSAVRPAGTVAHMVGRWWSAETKLLIFGGIGIFLLATTVVFQPWYWDNTKFLGYWYLALGIGIAAAAWRMRSHWGAWALELGIVSMVLTGAVVIVRWGPWTPAADQIIQDYVLMAPSDVQLADALVRDTSPHAVFATGMSHEDPVMILTGRQVVAGYEGWLWSYGLQYLPRKDALTAILAGCPSSIRSSQCAVRGLLRKYDVSYVEVDTVHGDGLRANALWWQQQDLPVVAAVQGITVYDVRGVTRT